MMDRQLWQEIRFRILARSPLSLLRRLTGTNLIIPYYHIVSDEEILHVKHLYQYKTTTEFKEDLDFLLKNYLPVGLPSFLIHIKTVLLYPEGVSLLTFITGYRG